VDKREATRLAKQIDKYPGLIVTGYRRWPCRGGASWEINVQAAGGDGGTFIIASREAWLSLLEEDDFWRRHEYTY